VKKKGSVCVCEREREREPVVPEKVQSTELTDISLYCWFLTFFFPQSTASYPQSELPSPSNKAGAGGGGAAGGGVEGGTNGVELEIGHNEHVKKENVGTAEKKI